MSGNFTAFAHGHYLAPTLLGVTWALAGLATILVASRFYVAVRILHRVGWDFFWALMALLLGIADQCILTLAVAHGTGKELTGVDPSNASLAFKYDIIAIMIGLLVSALGKIAIVALLLHLQGFSNEKGRWFLHFMWSSALALNLVHMFLLIFECKPVSRLFNPLTHGSCPLQHKVVPNASQFTGAWSAMVDFVLALYPVFIFWDLSMSWQKKLGLCGILGGGLLAGCAAAIRTHETQSLALFNTYEEARVLIWIFVEFWLIIILGSIPTIRPLFVALFHLSTSLVSRSSGPSNSSTNYHGAKPGASAIRLSVVQRSGPMRNNGHGNDSPDSASDTSDDEIFLPVRDHGAPLPTRDGIMVTRTYDAQSDRLEIG